MWHSISELIKFEKGEKNQWIYNPFYQVQNAQKIVIWNVPFSSFFFYILWMIKKEIKKMQNI